jgi:hypothetical protein
VSMCLSVGMKTCVPGCESRDSSSGGGCRAILSTGGGGERGMREGLAKLNLDGCKSSLGGDKKGGMAFSAQKCTREDENEDKEYGNENK